MSSKPAATSRPLSPFMLGQYYQFQLTSVLSFAHRITGLGLAMGTVLIAFWVMSAAAGPYAYANFSWIAKSILGKLLLLGWSWALLYHMCNGVRHLLWDTGRAFTMKSVYSTGYFVVGLSFALTAVVWVVAFAF